jgi:hypothetical protein
MYEQTKTWLPSAQQMGLGQITFDHLRRAARRSRGMGQAASGCGTDPCTWTDAWFLPGSTCCTYLACAAANGTLGSESNLWTYCPQAPSIPQQVAATVGSTAGTLVNSTVNAALPPSTPDACTQNLGMSCMSLGLIAAAVVLGLVFLKGGR